MSSKLRAGDRKAPDGSLTAQTLAGFVWLTSGSGARAVLQILVLAVLARLLTPDEFGIVSAALAVVALAELFGQIGVAPAIVQVKEIDTATIRTGSTITILSGFLSGAVLFLASPLMAGLFRIPEVEPVLRAFSIIFVISGFAVVPEALLQRDMRFRAIALTTLFGYLFGYALVGIALAVLGFGIWALVWANVVQYLTRSVLFIVLAHAPMLPLMQRAALRHLVRFGAGVTLSRLGNYLALNLDYFIVGRWLGPEALGIYSRAYLLLVQPANLIGSAAEKVLFPALSSLQDKHERFLRAYYRAVALIALTTLPASAVLIVLAPELINLLLGDQWDRAILPFQLLVLALVFRTAYKLTGTVLRANGAVFLLALWQWIYAALVAIGAMVGLRWGIAGVAVGVSLAILVAFWNGIWFTGMALQTSWERIAGAMVRYGTLAALIFAPVVACRFYLVAIGAPDVVVIAASGSLGGIVYLTVWLLLPRLFGEEGVWLRAMVAPGAQALMKRWVQRRT